MIVVNQKTFFASEKPENAPLTSTEASGDYIRISLEITTPEKSVNMMFGDYYHDKGYDKAIAVLKYLRKYYGEENVKYTSGNFSDGDEYLF